MPAAAVYQDGGWGWVLVFSSAVAEFIVVGSLKAFGVLLVTMKNDFEEDLWVIGTINSLHLGVQFILSKL